nr:hypothetical protein [Streptomyces boncukensis]
MPDRKEREVRRMLDGVQPLPPELGERARALGARVDRRRRVLRRCGWLLLLLVVLALVVWALVADPWSTAPPETTPPVSW